MATRFRETDVRLDREVAARVKGMLRRGDSVEDIAGWFGISERVVHSVQTGAVHQLLAPAPSDALPPPGPYTPASVRYKALEEARAAERRLHSASTSGRSRYRRTCDDSGAPRRPPFLVTSSFSRRGRRARFFVT